MIGSTHKIIHKHGHVEVVDEYGKFVLSANNESEAIQELIEMIKKEYNKEYCKVS